MLQSSNPNRYDDFSAIFPILKPIPEAASLGLLPNYSLIADNILKWEPKLITKKEQILSALEDYERLSREHLGTFLGGIFVPESCRKEAIPLPEFEVNRFVINLQNRYLIYNTFKYQISRNRPLSWPFCINDTCQSQHVLVVFGTRKICSKVSNNCQRQFLLRDSGTELRNKPGDYWIDEAFIEKKLDLMFNNYQELSDTGLLPDTILNLEYK